MTHTLAVVCCSFLIVNGVRGQDNVELPRFAGKTIVSDVQVPDAGHHFHPSSPPRSSHEILAANRVENRYCSKTVADGITTYDIIHDNQPLTLIIYPDGKIDITVVRTFNSDNVEALRTDFPKLFLDFDAFPRTTDPESRVRLNLEIETTYSFTGPGELEQERADLHRIYHRYTCPPVVTWSK